MVLTDLTAPGLWGIGVIARNESGLVMASGTWLRPGFPCAATAEAWGVYQAMVFAHDCGFARVQFECDNEGVMKKLNGTRDDQRNYLGSILDSIFTFQSYFRHCMFSHVRRSGNKVAHFLAHLAATEPEKVWIEDVPPNAYSLYFDIPQATDRDPREKRERDIRP